jgi:hypothetical protein
MCVQLTPDIMKQYELLAADSVLYTGKETINAINAGARVKKLLQLCTGSVYTEDGKSLGVHNERYELVMQLVSERKHSLVAFNWRHEREHMVKLAEEMGIEYDVIDGETPTYNAEHYQQFNRRIYRAGQTQKTEIIHIAASDTWEPDVYTKLENKLERMEDLLNILNQLTPMRVTT